ncbi:hypothetical protein AERO8C_170139 [Aeromonas veronii]|uniref:Uncharacterized protein n=1 Tax=Aeromonas veronii TaxID=654 RepID=A0A653L116_AERVE|nr:hypothetical protein AERO8C_170139 [Aeromonas veronii]
MITQRLGSCGWLIWHQAFGWMGPDDGDQIADFSVITIDLPQGCAIKKGHCSGNGLMGLRCG